MGGATVNRRYLFTVILRGHLSAETELELELVGMGSQLVEGLPEMLPNSPGRPVRTELWSRYFIVPIEHWPGVTAFVDIFILWRLQDREIEDRGVPGFLFFGGLFATDIHRLPILDG
ncbi:hypothetical protein PM082_009670 [Marasmius tenuissimus]|nr:hypothetical protein PM082_009670 [Marasmius tenuissimus]